MTVPLFFDPLFPIATSAIKAIAMMTNIIIRFVSEKSPSSSSSSPPPPPPPSSSSSSPPELPLAS